MMTAFAIYTAMCDTVREPVHTAISIDFDMEGRRAKCQAQGVATGRGEPILNPVTKQEFRGGIVLPNGFEYGQSEVGRGWSEATGALRVTLEDSHAHWSEMHLSRHGRIH